MTNDTLAQQAAWAARALALSGSHEPERIAKALLETLEEMATAAIQPGERMGHPSIALLSAQLAELAGLHFHWPTSQQERCKQLVARYRAEASCIPLAP